MSPHYFCVRNRTSGPGFLLATARLFLCDVGKQDVERLRIDRLDQVVIEAGVRGAAPVGFLTPAR